jgi:aminomethyltransferase
MGEIDVRGPGTLAYLQELTINDVSRMVDGQVQYNAMCYPHGGTVDDITLYRFSTERYLLCVNASNTDKDFAWMEGSATGDFSVKIRNVSDDYAQSQVRRAGDPYP